MASGESLAPLPSARCLILLLLGPVLVVSSSLPFFPTCRPSLPTRLLFLSPFPLCFDPPLIPWSSLLSPNLLFKSIPKPEEQVEKYRAGDSWEEAFSTTSFPSCHSRTRAEIPRGTARGTGHPLIPGMHSLYPNPVPLLPGSRKQKHRDERQDTSQPHLTAHGETGTTLRMAHLGAGPTEILGILRLYFFRSQPRPRVELCSQKWGAGRGPGSLLWAARGAAAVPAPGLRAGWPGAGLGGRP